MNDDPGDGDPENHDDSGADNADDPFEVIEEPDPDNPFERMDVGEREADPFERIDDADAPAEETDTADPFDAIAPEQESSAEAGGDDATGESATPEARAADADDPFAELGRDERTGDPFEGMSEDRVDAGDASQPDEELWEDLSRSDVEPETETHGQRRFAEVSKHTYCERCEYFSEPPEIACAHDGTDIVEFVDYETVRVADCPVVAEREELAEIDAE